MNNVRVCMCVSAMSKSEAEQSFLTFDTAKLRTKKSAWHFSQTLCLSLCPLCPLLCLACRRRQQFYCFNEIIAKFQHVLFGTQHRRLVNVVAHIWVFP